MPKLSPDGKESILLVLQLVARVWLFVGVVVTIVVGVVARSPDGSYSLVPWALSEASIAYMRKYL